MISSTTKSAVVRIAASVGGEKRTGTAFLVSNRLLLTAMHVVADRASALRGVPPRDSAIEVVRPADARSSTARLVDKHWHAADDWAVLELDSPWPGAVPLRLGEVRGSMRSRFVAYGFPVDHQHGLTVAGEVRDASGNYHGSQAIQLYCEELAAGSGDPLHGMSGAPCLVRDIAVGVIRSHPLKVGAVAMSAVRTVRNGVMYACPAAAFMRTLADVLPRSDWPALNLDEFSTGPAVPVHEVPLDLINAIAELHAMSGEAEMVITEANSLKSALEPSGERQYIIRRSSLPDPALGAQKFWHSAFSEAGKQGPRMMAALLQAIGPSRLEAPIVAQYQDLIERLRSMGH